MPNWTDSKMKVLLPTEKAKLFLSYFDGSEKNKGPQFYGTNLDEGGMRETDGKNGMSVLELNFECRWSVGGCMGDAHHEYAEGDAGKCISLLEACVACGVKELIMKSTEPGMGFAEGARYSKGDESIEFRTVDYLQGPDDVWFDADAKAPAKKKAKAGKGAH